MCRTNDDPLRSRVSFSGLNSISHFLSVVRLALPLSCLSFPVCLSTSDSPSLSATMSIPSHATARCCRQLLRPSTSALRLSSATYRIPNRRWQSTESEAPAAPANPKITQIVDQISQLNLMETADLVASLKVRSVPNLFSGSIAHFHTSFSCSSEVTYARY